MLTVASAIEAAATDRKKLRKLMASPVDETLICF